MSKETYPKIVITDEKDAKVISSLKTLQKEPYDIIENREDGELENYGVYLPTDEGQKWSIVRDREDELVLICEVEVD